MKKTWFDMTEAERKQAIEQEKKQREDLFSDLIENAPRRAEEESQAQIAEAAAQTAEKEALFKTSVRESFIAANGSEWGFENAWPALRAQIVEQRTLANVGNKAASSDLVTRFIEQANSR